MADSRICSVEGCDKKHYGKGFCQRHYNSFNRNGDPLAAKPRRSPQLGRVCSEPGCDRKVMGRDLCSMHYKRLWREQHLDGVGQKRCSVEGCENIHDSKGFCAAHYSALVTHGDPLVRVRRPAIPRPADGKCTLAGCDRPYDQNGYCTAHYKRFHKYGDPEGGSTGRGEVRRWLDEVAIPYHGDDCLTFPYTRNHHGYGQVRVNHRAIGAHVYVLRATQGRKPTSKHECCHDCGMGHIGCVNPRHLYWGTRAQNIEDQFRHGVRQRSKKRQQEIEARNP